MRRCPLALSFLIALATVGARPRIAHACGGCFAPATERTVVNAHRMAFSISPKQTVLWDQIRYSGDPREFAWVLPVRAGARVELSREEWFAALDASTQPVVITPSTGPYGGCALAGCGASSNSALFAGPDDTVHVLAENVVGPYETATLRSTNANALVTWLDTHGFVLPAQNRPTVDAYVAEGFDFIALRLRPQCSERAMKPVRIVTPGADPTLPLRMVAAGVGASVDILLYVVGEGRWRPKNFPEVLFDDTKLSFNTGLGVSNYETLAQSLMAQKGGTSWLTEAAGQPDLGGWYPGHPELSGPSTSATSGFATVNMAAPPNPGLAPTYFAFCHGATIVPGTRSMVVAPQPCASSSAIDSGSDDASDAGADGADGGGDASRADGGAEAANDSAVGLADTGADSTPDGETADATSDAESWDGADGAVDAEAAAADGADASDEPDAVAVDSGEVTVDSGEETSLASGAGNAAGDSGNSYTPAWADPCKGFDDLDVALDGVHPQDVWVTRLRAKLPVYALATDLVIEASPSQTAISSVHQVVAAPAVQSRQGCVTGTGPRDAFGTGALVTFTALGLGAIFRRRRG